MQTLARKTFPLAFLITAASYAQPPQNTSVVPSSGNGLGPQIFAFSYSDPNGYADINWVQMLTASGSLSGLQSCYFYYSQPANIYLANDIGNGWAGSGSLGEDKTVENGQCKL